MIYRTTKEILSEIRHFMFLNDISIKELALRMHKSQQSVSQIFSINNPRLETLILMCNALNLDIDIDFIIKNDTNWWYRFSYMGFYLILPQIYLYILTEWFDFYC